MRAPASLQALRGEERGEKTRVTEIAAAAPTERGWGCDRGGLKAWWWW